MNTYKKIAIGIAAAGLTVTASLAGNASRSMENAGTSDNTAAAILHANDAAYRDGLYVAKVHAENGNKFQASVGRWSSEADRSSFAAGYQDGSSPMRRASGAE